MSITSPALATFTWICIKLFYSSYFSFFSGKLLSIDRTHFMYIEHLYYLEMNSFIQGLFYLSITLPPLLLGTTVTRIKWWIVSIYALIHMQTWMGNNKISKLVWEKELNNIQFVFLDNLHYTHSFLVIPPPHLPPCNYFMVGLLPDNFVPSTDALKTMSLGFWLALIDIRQ